MALDTGAAWDVVGDEPTDPLAFLLAGTPYRARAILGQGGMGDVLEAEHAALRKIVVVKLLRADLAREPRLAERMRLEAQTLAGLAHPNIVTVTDFGMTAEGRAYIAMERLQGLTLAQELRRRGPFPIAEAIEHTRQVLNALGAAHEAGLVHRDVKADNVFLCDPGPDGRRVIKLLDFGIVKLLPTARSRDHGPAPLAFATEEGVLLGSPRTVSPEQVRCEAVDARADIYATGLLLHTLVAGKGPFSHVRGVSEVLAAHVYQSPTPLSRATSGPVPRALETAILKALAKRANERFGSAREFSAELGHVAAALSAKPCSAPSSRPFQVRPTSGADELTRIAGPMDRTAVLPPDAVAPAGGAATVVRRSRRDAPRPLWRKARSFLLVTVVSGVLFFALLMLGFRLVRGE